MNKTKTVTIGGGTGTYAVISALKKLDLNISSVVAVSDSGGSTGRIRDEFGFQPVGDLRQSLAAMADPDSQDWIRKILLYRFKKGSGLSGHNLGNLILTALQDMTGSTTESLRIASNVFQVVGQVIPITETNVQLAIYYDDGTMAIGEHLLDDDTSPTKKVNHVELQPHCEISADAQKAILNADYIFIGPGDLYASIMAVLIAGGVKETLQKSPAKIIYLSNLMTRKAQTHGMSARDHLEIIETAIGRPVGQIIINNGAIPKETLDYYAKEEEYPVLDDFNGDQRVVKSDIISSIEAKQNGVDSVRRSVLRHDSNKLAKIFSKFID